MRCPNCQSDIPNGFRYCLQCGEDLGAPTLVRAATVLNSTRSEPPTDRRRSLLPAVFGGTLGGIGIGLVIVLALVGGYSLFTYFYDDPLGIAVTPRHEDPVTTRTPAPRSEESAETPAVPRPMPTAEAAQVRDMPNNIQFQRAALRDESIDSYEKIFRASMPRGSVAVAIDGPHYGSSPYSESYLFRARAGQWFAVRLIPKGAGSPFFAVSDRLTDQQLTAIADVRGAWAQTLPMSGDFAIRVCCDGAFRLEVVIR